MPNILAVQIFAKKKEIKSKWMLYCDTLLLRHSDADTLPVTNIAMQERQALRHHVHSRCLLQELLNHIHMMFITDDYKSIHTNIRK